MPRVGANPPRVAREAPGQRERHMLEEGGQEHTGTMQETCRGQEGQEDRRRASAYLLQHRPQIASPAQEPGTHYCAHFRVETQQN